ncbi:thiamine ABC transporter substrate-binding protein [Aquihabitans sp. G128]|uniref:thiamine ABC transporter substrate-binding protein n=1 Tax=Aquihabitans sp. G128 TaxID=2849779 RepID=UPI001C247566|nr:thiamine ABC transporter substrate-binding protein [Aquihabitans sp. G128]QXC59159.1 thiamine ABC transporter substrate-binding protein [Aquihabitans sp. G128]
MTVSVPSTSSSRRRRRAVPTFVAVVALAAAFAGCTSDPSSAPVGGSKSGATGAAACRPDDVPAAISARSVADADTSGTTITLVTHDSFATSKGIFEPFTKATGITVKLLTSGDAGTLVSQSVLTAGKPVADVLFGIDTTFLCRGTKAGLFTPYAPKALAQVDRANQLAPDHLATPIDVGDVCLNYSKQAFPKAGAAPTGLDDLTKPAFADDFVTENPETSSPGFAFLLATISTYGEDGWQQYWKDLRANGVKVDPGWEEAYEGSFGSGTGKRSIVTSYATSPVADVVYSDPPRTTPAIGVVADACFRQVEFAGVLRGTDHPEAAAKLVDYLLSRRFQEDIPLNMFVEPVNRTAKVPEAFAANRTPIDHPLTLTPAEIEAGRDGWTEAWTRIVLR